MDGIASVPRLPGRFITTYAWARPSSPIPAAPSQTRRQASMPMAMAISAIAANRPSSRMFLSCPPNLPAARCCSTDEARSTNLPPTTLTGDACGRTNAAVKFATPTATAAPSNPVTAPASSPRPRGPA